jgi:formylglycine-generating enzyme required for sulfatase activity
VTKTSEEEVCPSASSAAAAGTTTPGTAARPSASGASRASGTTTLGSDQPSDWQRDDDERVYRGGGWCYLAWYCRATLRNWDEPGKRYYYLGFRPSFRLEKR